MTEEQRESWSSATLFGVNLEFILSAIGYAVGLGNVWRFPYICARNGGGVFLIPYFLALFLAGIPCFFLEMGMGQFGKNGSINVFDSIPILRGVGFAMVMVSFFTCIYYNVVLVWAIMYRVNFFLNFIF